MASQPYTEIPCENVAPAPRRLAQDLFARHDPRFAWTVSELSHLLKEVVAQELAPFHFWLGGEIVFNAPPARHVYATLRDERQNSIPLVFFQGAELFRKLELKSGEKVIAYGSLTLYAPKNTLQFQATELQRAKDDKESLMEAMRKSLARLAAEGLTDPARKKTIPPFPKCVGLVTSPAAAGFRDFVHTCFARAAHLSLLLSPTRGQGNSAAEEIRNALQLLDDTGECDLIVVTRGGGSIEDLWCFNDELLARAIASARTPVVTAIGHERDNTLVDFVADRYAITPTKAAEMVTEGFFQAARERQTLTARLRQAILQQGQLRRTRLQHCLKSPHLLHPEILVSERKSRLATDEGRLYQALPSLAEKRRSRLENARHALLLGQDAILQRKRAALGALKAALRTLDPTGVLKRGYSILLDQRKRAIRKAEDAPRGTRLHALLGDGSLTLAVEESQTAIPQPPTP